MNFAAFLDYGTKIVGIGGGVLGAIAYVNSRRMKRIDLRIELQKAHLDLRALVGGLKTLLSHASISKQRALASSGRSGDWMAWSRTHVEDLPKVTALEMALNGLPTEYQKLSFLQLESGLVEVHALSSQAARVKAHYDASVAEDVKTVDYNKQVVLRPRP